MASAHQTESFREGPYKQISTEQYLTFWLSLAGQKIYYNSLNKEIDKAWKSGSVVYM